MAVTALLGPTNTGKTHRAIERMLEHPTGMIGLPLRLLAREVYDRITAQLGEQPVALVTGEEKRVPPDPRYWVCTVESMPIDREVDFLCVDEIQLSAHAQRGHTFTERLLHARGREETWLLGADTMRPLVEALVPTARIVGHPRLSTLSYTGTHALASLPPRTAVVAFSADEVYAIAERLRRRHGGTAVVLGALSPRTRNAQVAMYQAGEVHHLVATDAIGMGLNLDVDRIVFAALDKFDGKRGRALEIDELAQIAGRAGRYTTAGGFGTLRPLPELAPPVVDAIEQHRFTPVRRLVWRNADLDLSSVPGLVASLRQRPRHPALRLVEQADDFDALMALSRLDTVRTRAQGGEAIALLWDVCRIPDFRKLMLDSHVRLLARIFDQLSGPQGRIDPDWMARRLARLDTTEGDIETLMGRIAFIRTWTYVTHHEAWVDDAAHWQAVARDLEDRQSDALHERLTERFVERPSGGPTRSPAARRRERIARARVDAAAAGSPFSALRSLHDRLAPDPDAVPDSDAASIEALVTARHDAFFVQPDGKIHHADRPIAVWRRGADPLHPEVVVSGLFELGAGARARVLRRVQAWTRDAIEGLFAPLTAVEAEVGAQARGLVYQLRQGFGTLQRRDATAQLRRMTSADARVLQAAGIELGRRVVYMTSTTKPAAVRLRAALWNAWTQPTTPPPLPGDAAVSIAIDDAIDPQYWSQIGFVVVAGRAIRADQLERALARLAELEPGPFARPAELGGWLGIRGRGLVRVLRGLGYRQTDAGWIPRGTVPTRP